MHASETIYSTLAPLFDERVYPIVISEHENIKPPYAIYNIITSNPLSTLDGYTGHDWVRVQIDIYDSDYDELIALTKQAIIALDNHTSTYLGTTYHKDGELYRSISEYHLWQD